MGFALYSLHQRHGAAPDEHHGRGRDPSPARGPARFPRPLVPRSARVPWPRTYNYPTPTHDYAVGLRRPT